MIIAGISLGSISHPAAATLCCIPSTNSCQVQVGGTCPGGSFAVAGTTCTPSPCTALWFTGPWSGCSANCGTGSQTRNVFCMISSTIVADSACAAVGTKPATTQSCSNGPCTAQWVSGAWSGCSSACGPGIQTRPVFCMDNGMLVSDGACSTAGVKPATSQACNNGSCIGACCLGATCSGSTSSACSTSGGRFVGFGIACNDLAHGVTDTPCCLANYDGINGLEVADIFGFLNAWLAGNARADFNGNGLAVQDIFDYLNAWFAGC